MPKASIRLVVVQMLTSGICLASVACSSSSESGGTTADAGAAGSAGSISAGAGGSTSAGGGAGASGTGATGGVGGTSSGGKGGAGGTGNGGKGGGGSGGGGTGGAGQGGAGQGGAGQGGAGQGGAGQGGAAGASGTGATSGKGGAGGASGGGSGTGGASGSATAGSGGTGSAGMAGQGGTTAGASGASGTAGAGGGTCVPMPGADCCPSMDCGTSLGMSCNAGKCGCDAGFADCDPKVPGCETEIGGGDAFNCGACGFSCQGGACSTGVCEPKALSAVVPGDLCIGTVDETYLYGRRADGSITAYDKVTGQAMEVTGPGDTAFCGSGVLPDELAVDGTDLYYMTSDEVRVVPKKGGSPTTFITLAGNSDFPNGGEVGGYGGLVVDATNVYFAGIYGTYAISKSTLAVKMLDASGFRRALLVKNGKLYAGDVMSGIVSVDDVAGGGSNTIASGQNSPWGIFVDDTYVYWTNEADGGGSFFNGSIWSKPLAGGAAKNLTGDVLTQARVVTGDDKDLYFPMNGGIVSMPREGGPTRTLTKTHGDDMLTRLFVEPGFVYFVSSGTPYRLAK